MNKGSSYKRKDGRWESRMYIGKEENGKRKYRSFYGKTREEAEYKLMLASRNIDDEYALTEMTVSYLVNEWFHVISSRVKESTSANYRMKADKHIIPAFGNTQCCFLKTKEIYAFIDRKMKEGLSVRYIYDILVLLKSIFRYASREYRIKNVFENIVMPKHTNTDISILSKDQQIELEEYISANPSLTALGISLSLYMGIRIGELCALQWENIDFEKRIITVKKTMQRIQNHNGQTKTKLIITEPKSTNSIREIPIPDFLINNLREFRKADKLYVLSGNIKPVEPRTMQYRFSKILKNANLPSVHYHSLRHLFATNCIALGFDVKTLSEILGHSSVEVTLSRYVHSSMERKRAYMKLMTFAA